MHKQLKVIYLGMLVYVLVAATACGMVQNLNHQYVKSDVKIGCK